MSSTFTAPIRVNTRQTTSNNGTISADNTGAVVLTQQVTVTTIQDASIVLPAGSIINFVQFFATTAGTLRNLELDGVSVGDIVTSDPVSYGVLSDVVAANVGPADAVLTALADSDGSAGVFSVMYTARNADGTITPYGSGYTNN